MDRSIVVLVVILLSSLAFAQTNNLQGLAASFNTPSSSSTPYVPFPLPNIPTFSSLPQACSLDCGWNSIDVSGAATLNVRPDIASVNVQVTGSGRTTNDAITILSQKITTVLSTLTNLGLNSTNWQTTYLNVYANTSYVNGTTITYGQIASQSMIITVPMPNSNGSTVAKIYDGLAQVNDITINSLTFDLQDKTNSYIQARKLAYQDARKRAVDYTAAAGVTLGAPLTITDSYSSAPVVTPIANSGVVRTMAFKAEVPTTVSVGTIAINYNVQVVFSFA